MTGVFERFGALPDFPFRRLAAMLAERLPPDGVPVLDLSIGEPQHAPPALLAETVAAQAGTWNRYPPPGGTPAFRSAVAAWLQRRYALPEGMLDADRHVLPLAGTKEGLFLLPSVLPAKPDAAILLPNPLYAVYLGGEVLAGARPVPLATTAATGFLPDLDALDERLLEHTTAFFLCTPANPQGAVASQAYLERLLRLARRHDFLLIVDECYAEIWDEAPPAGGLQAAAATGGGLDHLVVLHSLSKRSNAAGLRSGFIAGDSDLLARFGRLRAYGAAVQPLPLMAAATRLWQDEVHVEANRAAYRAKLDLAERRLGNRFGFYRPAGGFFLWLDVGDGVAAARRLWSEAALKVLPGSFLTMGSVQPGLEDDPGARYIRLALVHDETTIDGAFDRLIEVLG